MIIGVMSDTHGHLTEMRLAASQMVERYAADVIIHIGDDSTDADELASLSVNVITVPGIFEARYRDPGVQNRVIHEFDGIPFLLTHTPTKDPHDKPSDIDPTEAAQDGDAKVVLYGHTHTPLISEKFGAIYINPGHLNKDDRRGEPSTFAIIETRASRLIVKIIELKGKISQEKTFFIE